MLIEVGKIYLDRKGLSHKIAYGDKSGDFLDQYGITYKSDGTCYKWIDDKTRAFDYDLVEEIKVFTKSDEIDLYSRSFEHSSIETQLKHLTEEFSEMFIQMSHLERGRITDTTELTLEIADVLIMIEQMKYIFAINDDAVMIAKQLKLNKFSKIMDKVELEVKSGKRQSESGKRRTF